MDLVYYFDKLVTKTKPGMYVKPWQEEIKKLVYTKILGDKGRGGLNNLELAEFLYFNIKNMDINYQRAEKIKKYESFDIEMLLAVRSVVGADLAVEFNKNIFGLG